MDAAIETRGLSKTYRGGVQALSGVDLTVNAGEVFGFVGPNGAGKSTLIRSLLDLIRPTAGTARLLGIDSRDPRSRERVGYLPGDPRLHPRLSGRAQLDSLLRLRPVGGGYEDLAERFGAALDRPLRDLSKGNRQKIALIQAFMQRPALVVLDEPTSGLDPLVQEEFRSLVRETASSGSTVFLSSHSLDEVQHVAHRVGIIRGGRLVAVDVVEAMLERSVRHVSVRFAEPVDLKTFAQIPGVQVVDGDGPSLSLRVEGSMEPLVKALGGERVIDLTSTPADLEEIFLGYYQEQGE